MPKVEFGAFEGSPEIARVVGTRIRQLREIRKFSVRELAERAKVNKNTLLRIEKGGPVTPAVLQRVCDALHTVLPNLMVPEEQWELPYRVHRAVAGDWRIAFNRRAKPSTQPDFTPIESPAERARLGQLGFVVGYQHTHHCTLRGGRLQAATLEIYGPQDHPGFRHMGEEYVYCLRGRVRVVFRAGEVVLEEGDSMTFWSHHRHLYESAMPPDYRGPGPLLLMLWIEDEGDADALGEPPLRPIPVAKRSRRRRTS